MGDKLQRIVQVRVGPPGGTGRRFGDEDDGTRGLDIQFTTHSGDYGRPGECSLRIFNLSDKSRRLLLDRTHVASLRVGYKGSGTRVIFDGNPAPETLNVTRAGGDWITSITLRDGGLAYDRGRVEASFRTSVTGRQVLDEILRQTGMGEGQVDVASADWPRRYAYSGSARGALDELAKRSGPTHRWFIRDGNLFILAASEATQETGPVFSSDNRNLVGAPEPLEGSGVRFKGMLDASVRVGRKVRLESKFITGWFKVVEASFVGDNFGGGFYVNVKGTEYLT